MAEPWIRVHAALVDKPVIDRAVEALGVSEHEAIGLMVTFWGAVSQNVIRGQVGDHSDRQIERWARWHGRRGVFAKFIRAQHLDEEGRVNEWDEYAGALETRREKERERLRNKRAPLRNKWKDVAQPHAENGDGVRKLLQPARANEDETIRNEKIKSSSSSPATGDFAEGESDLAARLVSDTDRNALTTILAAVAAPATWILEMRASLDGMGGHTHATPSQLGEALRDYVGNGALQSPNLKHFRRYIERATRAPPPAESNGRKAHGPPKGSRQPPQTYEYTPTPADEELKWDT